MLNRLCMHCYVSGKVQGVWYRASTEEEARKLGLTGWVRNLPDGRVEVMVCGEKDRVEQLVSWLRKGPPLAQVSKVETEMLEWDHYPTFSVR